MRGKNTKISDSLDIKNALTLKTLQFYFGKFSLRVHREIALHHPVVIGGVRLQNFHHRFAYMFAKIKASHPVLIVSHAVRIVN
jgi:hypothetical protein